MEVKKIEMPDGVTLSDGEKKFLDLINNTLVQNGEAVEKSLAALNESIRKGIDTTLVEKGVVDTKEMAERVKSLSEDLKAMKEGVIPNKNQGGFYQKLKDFLENDSTRNALKKEGSWAILEYKADPSPILTTNATEHSLTYEVIPGIIHKPREQNRILDLLSKGSTSSSLIVWINEGLSNGEAAFVEEGNLKPLVDIEFNEERSNAGKAAVRTKVSTEMLQDFAYMKGEINYLLSNKLFDKVDATLLTGTGTSGELKGILTGATGYLGTSVDGQVPFANTADAIRAVIDQMRQMNLVPDVVLLNPTNNTQLDLTKSTTGNYIRKELDVVLRNIQIIETTAVEAGKMVVLDSSKFIVKPYLGYVIKMGHSGEDFSNNMVTVIAEMRLHSYHSSIYDGAIVYDSIDTVKAALQKAA